MKRTAIWSLAATLLAVCVLGCPGKPQADSGPGTTASPPPAPAASASEGPGAADGPASGGPAADGPGTKLMNSRDAVPDKTLEKWLGGLGSRGDEGFLRKREASDELQLYLTESMSTTGFCLTESVDPHRGATEGVRWSARVSDGNAPDSLRASWEAEGVAFTLTETVNVLLVEAQRTAKPTPPLDEGSLRSLLATVVQLKTPDHDWTFEFPEGANLAEGTHLISNQGAPEVLFVQSRDSRADVLLVGGRVWFVFYKKIAQRLAFEKEHAWFRASTREALTR